MPTCGSSLCAVEWSRESCGCARGGRTLGSTYGRKLRQGRSYQLRVGVTRKPPVSRHCATRSAELSSVRGLRFRRKRRYDCHEQRGYKTRIFLALSVAAAVRRLAVRRFDAVDTNTRNAPILSGVKGVCHVPYE